MASYGRFEPHHHRNGIKAIDGYVLEHGEVKRVNDESFPKGEVMVGEFSHQKSEINGKGVGSSFRDYAGRQYKVDKKSV